ncbi:MAG: AbrB/MazE/SpoVT family DNA-binding domain-containing protein [Thermaerobacter sp.]|nr:AbrB/MazE/SpoVT family DNA-binding domain-containing protein [Thermaerobacter sp.]MDA8146187.1 AbrB/MazE/SpoVT family DNA-binding domain-containing protein [Thermaerobacter sp.]
MKVTGFVRRTDHMGRFVIPQGIRRALGFASHQPLAVAVDGDSIVLEKEVARCVICGAPATEEFAGKGLCADCLHGLAGLGRP